MRHAVSDLDQAQQLVRQPGDGVCINCLADICDLHDEAQRAVYRTRYDAWDRIHAERRKWCAVAPGWLLNGRPELPPVLDLSLDHVRFGVILGLAALDLPLSYDWTLCASPFKSGDPALGMLVLKAVLEACADPHDLGPLPIGVLGPWTPAYKGLFPPKKYDPAALDPEHREWRREPVAGLLGGSGVHRLHPHVNDVADRFGRESVGWTINIGTTSSGGGKVSFSMTEWRRGPESGAAGRDVVDVLLRDHTWRGRRYQYLLLDAALAGSSS